MNEKQRKFCYEYVKDLDGTKAAIRAGYSEKTASGVYARLSRDKKINNLITNLQREIADSCKVDAKWLLARLRDETTADLADLMETIVRPVMDLGDDGKPTAVEREVTVFKHIADWPQIYRQGLVASFKLGEDGRPVEVKLADIGKRLEMIAKHVDVAAYDQAAMIDASTGQAVARITRRIVRDMAGAVKADGSKIIEHNARDALDIES
jgi:phage terminase small subunit